MIDNAVIDKIISLSDTETGGDNALDGFEFQVSTAIYLMFEEIKKDSEFALVYEKIEDFIIFTDKIRLYQAKSISRNLTPNVLYSPGRKTKQDNTGLSIIEKMNHNYIYVKEHLDGHQIDNNLIICKNCTFSTKLTNKISNLNDLREFNFNYLDDTAKQDIIDKTKFDNYDWSNINAIRLIPKPWHTEVTRSFIEDVIEQVYGRNMINTNALYNSLSCEIRKIRKNKEKLTSEFLINQVGKYAAYEEVIKFENCYHLLHEQDRMNINLNRYFKICINNLTIDNHPYKDAYKKLVKTYVEYNTSIHNVYVFYDIVKSHDKLKDICIQLNDYEIKVSILIILAKEVIK